jgi:hypothetical protein
MTATILLNLLLVIGVLCGLVGVCRLPFSLKDGYSDQLAAKAERAHEYERRAA